MLEVGRLILYEERLRARLRRGLGARIEMRSLFGQWMSGAFLLFFRCALPVFFAMPFYEQSENGSDLIGAFVLSSLFFFLLQWSGFRHLRSATLDNWIWTFYAGEDRYAAARILKVFGWQSLLTSCEVVVLAVVLKANGIATDGVMLLAMAAWLAITAGTMAVILLGCRRAEGDWASRLTLVLFGYLFVGWLGLLFNFVPATFITVPGRFLAAVTPQGWIYQALLATGEPALSLTILLAFLPAVVLALMLPSAVRQFRAQFRLSDAVPDLEANPYGEADEEELEQVAGSGEPVSNQSVAGYLRSWETSEPVEATTLSQRISARIQTFFTVRERVLLDAIYGRPFTISRRTLLWSFALVGAMVMARLGADAGLLAPYPAIPVVLFLLIAVTHFSTAQRVMPPIVWPQGRQTPLEDNLAASHSEIAKIGLKMGTLKMICGIPWVGLALLLNPLEWIRPEGDIASTIGMMWLIWFLLLPAFAALWYGNGISRSKRRGSLALMGSYFICFFATLAAMVLSFVVPWLDHPLLYLSVPVTGVLAYFMWSLMRFGLRRNFFEIRLSIHQS